MKKICYLLLVLMLFSCGYDVVKIDTSKPFVVGNVEYYSNTHSKYVHINYTDVTMYKPAIIAYKDLWSVGDTISFDKLIKNKNKNETNKN